MMDNANDVLTSDNDEGKRKVLSENYAFLMESSSIQYIAQRECNLSQIGGLLDQKGYGIAMRKSMYIYFINFLMDDCIYQLHEMLKKNKKSCLNQ